MNKNLYSKLAINNIRKNKSTYFPYIFSSVVIISLFYILYVIKEEVMKGGFFGGLTMMSILNLGVYTAGIFSVIFIFYTNSFLLKRRTKELGLYSVLGMEKKHISKVISYEIIYSGGFSLIFGILFGLLFSKLMFAFLLNILNLDTSILLAFSIKPVLVTVVLFFMVFILEIVFNVIKVNRINPIDLITRGKKGEVEPKSKWITGIIGVLALGAGYYIALSTENPTDAIKMLFVSVVLVAIGTYFIFTSGSIIFLKLLKKRKNFYYNKSHFISISNMIYRMKQNAVGLANIAILSTAVLLVISTTVSLYAGMEDIIDTRYPKDVMTDYIYEEQDIEEIETIIIEHGKANNVDIKDSVKCYHAGFPAYLKDNQLTGYVEHGNNFLENIYSVNLYTLEDYNREHEANLTLDRGEAFFYSGDIDFDYDSIVVLDREYKVKDNLKTINFPSALVFAGKINILVYDMEEMYSLISVLDGQGGGDTTNPIIYEYSFDLKGTLENKISFVSTLRETLNASIERVAVVEDKYSSRQSHLSILGSLFFIGVFLGALFMVATVLIIYYKQISEGYEDRKNFAILQNVGMSKGEVKKTIGSQMLLMFLLPLGAAVIHIIVAFPLVSKTLAILNLTNTKLFLICTGIVILVFGIIYGIVYRWTARVYYKIVN